MQDIQPIFTNAIRKVYEALQVMSTEAKEDAISDFCDMIEARYTGTNKMSIDMVEGLASLSITHRGNKYTTGFVDPLLWISIFSVYINSVLIIDDNQDMSDASKDETTAHMLSTILGDDITQVRGIPRGQGGAYMMYLIFRNLMEWVTRAI